MLTEPNHWPGGDVLVTVGGDLPNAARATLVVRDHFPDGRVSGEWRKPYAAFQAPGTYRLNLPPCDYRVETIDRDGNSVQLSVSIEAAPRRAKPVTESQRLEKLIADTMGRVVAVERRLKEETR